MSVVIEIPISDLFISDKTDMRANFVRSQGSKIVTIK